MALKTSIDNITHPYYFENNTSWSKWRVIYAGGDNFISQYLQKFSNREGDEDFKKRKSVSYNPAFAAEAVDEIKNSIFQHLPDIVRKGGSATYNEAILGQNGGMDLKGSSMNCFIGKEILPELLPISRVGVYLDMPEITGQTIAETGSVRPYLYTYSAEDIRSWCCDAKRDCYNNILLREFYTVYDESTNLPIGKEERYRHMWIGPDGYVMVQFYNSVGDYIDLFNNKYNEPVTMQLNITKIPFYICDIGKSLLENVDNYQIALLNLASSDMGYSLNSNFPFYTEQFDSRVSSEHLRVSGPVNGGQSVDGGLGKIQEIKIGTNKGRRYPKDMERPAFIHPSSEPLRASMDKQAQLKEEIRQLVNLNVSNLSPKMASAESKGFDRQGLESGLSYIGIELENMERKIAEYWAMYEKTKPATVIYPEVYSVKTSDQKLNEAKTLSEIKPSVPSKTFHQQVSVRIAELVVGSNLSVEDFDKIKSEIRTCKGINSDPDVIAKAVEGGYLDQRLAAELLDYPDDTVDKAEKEHADRLARIAESQSQQNTQNPAARGIKDLGGDSKQEKQQAYGKTQTDPIAKSKVRGKE